MEVRRIFDLLDNACEKFPRKDCLAAKIDGNWVFTSTQEYRQMATTLAYGLLALGVKKGDKIATVSNNRPEWNFIDMAIAMTGAIHVPVYPTISSKDYDFILNHAEVKFAFISDATAHRRVSAVADNIKTLEKMYSFNEIEGVENWKSVLELGKKSEVYYKEELEKAKAAVEEDDICSIIYTSGTTGLSKGAMLTHKNFCSNFTAACEILGLNHTHKILSILPLCHVYERCFCYMYQYLGIGIYYAQNLGTIVRDLCDIKANGCNTVPRVAEKIVEGIMKEGAKFTGLKKKMFDKAVELGRRFEHNNANGWFYNLELKMLSSVYKHWREDFFGGNMKFFGCGGAAISPNLSRMLWAAGIKVCEGYGLTETSPIIAHADVNHHKFSSCGPVVSNEHVKIAEDGEILVKGPNVMKGYYKNPEATAEVMTEDGYFHTGDIGYLSAGNFLHITDRKKDVFKTSSGKYIAPQMIEGKCKESQYISQVCIIGDSQKFASAIISPDFETLKIFLKKEGIEGELSNEEIIKNEKVIKLIDSEVQKVNKTLGKVEQIAKFRLIADIWSSQTGELTETQKLKRKVVNKKYEHIFNEIYGIEATR